MMHCNDIEKGMANQSTKGMKKGLSLYIKFEASTSAENY